MYLALYRKYRPRTFEDVVSQPHITTTLKNEVAAGKTAHAYLFTGPRGTGKTTCSKILAMAVNCEHPVDGNPCLTCDSCRGIEQGSILDVVEIDAASNNGVDNIRQLRDEASYTPSQCKYRVYIIDETHMLSAGAFNALLKIMEEPPPHVKFILATTEAHKVPATILSRCQRFDFRRIRQGDIRDRLLCIADQEPFSLTGDAAELIARLADGGMRDALSLLDQCAAFQDHITRETVAEAAGVVDREYLCEFVDCILGQNAGKALAAVDRLYSLSKDMQGLLEELIHYFRNLLLTKTLNHPEDLVGALPDELSRLQEYARAFSLGAILSALDEMQGCLDKMSRSFDKRLTLELCFVRLCSPEAGASVGALVARISRLEKALEDGLTAVPSDILPKAAVPPAKLPPAPQVEPPAELLSRGSLPKEVLSEEKPSQAEEIPQPSEPPAERISQTKPQAEGASSLDSDFQPVAEWAGILEDLSRTDAPLFGVLRGSQAFAREGFLYVDSGLSITAMMLKQEGNAAKLLAAVEKRTGKRYKIRVKSTPAQATEGDMLAELLSRVKEAGVEVREE